MLPYDNTVLEPEFARTIPEGISCHVIRPKSTDRKELAEESLVLASSMSHLRVNVALHACGASSFMQGRKWHDGFLERFQAAAGVPSESATSAMIKLLHERRVERVALVTPYPKWLLEPLEQFIKDCGLGVANIVGLGLEPPEINQLGPEHSYRLARQTDVPDADGVFILATNFRTLEILKPLTADLGKPVMSSNQALLWAAFRHLGVADAAFSLPERPLR